MSGGLVDLVVRDTIAFLEPLLDFDEPERLVLLFAHVGAPPDLAANPAMIATLQDLRALRDQVVSLADQPIASLAGLRTLLQAANTASQSLQSLGAFQGPEFATFGADLAQFLAVRWLTFRHPTLFEVARVLGLVETGEDAELALGFANANEDAILRYPFQRERFRPDRVGPLVEDLVGTLRAHYAPQGLLTNTSADAVATRLFPRLDLLARCVGATWAYGVTEEHRPLLGDAAPLVDHAGALYLPHTLTDGADVGVVFMMASAERADLGLVAMPFGTFDVTRTIGGWDVQLAASAAIEGVAFGRNGVTLLAPVGVESATAHVRAKLIDDPADGLAFVLGTPTTTRLEIGDIEVGADLAIDGEDFDFALRAAASRCAVVLSPGDGDSFLASIMPANGARVAFDIAAGWSTKHGFTLNGAAGGELTIATSINLGPLALDAVRLALAVDGSELTFEATAAVRAKLGPVEISADGFGLRGVLAMPSTGGSLGGAAFDLDVRLPHQLAVALRASVVRGGGVLAADPPAGRYAGALALDVGGQSLSAIGVLDTRAPGGYSLAAAVSASIAPVPLPFGFILDGVGGLIGINRRVDLEALRSAVRGPGMSDIFFPTDPVGQVARLTTDLARYLPAQGGRHVFGPAVRLRWGSPALLRATFALLLEVPSPVRVVLLGSITSALPTEQYPIIRLGADIVGEVDFADRRVAIDATLRPDSSVAGFPITGDLAFRLRWGDEPGFALSIGGFHSQFRRPTGFPELRPITIPLGSGDDPRLDVTGFLALTSNTAQVGANVDLYASAGPLNIRGNLGFETLIVFSPFSLQADLDAGVTLRRHERVLAGIHFDGHISGPVPWRVDGKATLSLWFVDLSVSVHLSLGGGVVVTLLAQDIWPLLRAELEQPASWSTEAAATGARVPTAAPADENNPPPRIDPGAPLSMRQRVVPLGRRITRFAHAAPAGLDEFRVTDVRLGATQVAGVPVTDWFAPAQFETLSDADKLSRPGFERMTAGVTLTPSVRGGPSLTKALEYETIVWADGRRMSGAPHRPTLAEQVAGTALGAVSRAATFTPPRPPPRFTFAEETFVIAAVSDLTPRFDLAGHVPRGEAELALRAHLAATPADAPRLVVIPSHELAA